MGRQTGREIYATYWVDPKNDLVSIRKKDSRHFKTATESSRASEQGIGSLA